MFTLCYLLEECLRDRKLKTSYIKSFLFSLIVLSILRETQSVDAQDSQKKITDSPLTFFVPQNSVVDYLNPYLEKGEKTMGHYIINLRPKSSINPSIALGVNDSAEYIITSESNSPYLSMVLITEQKYRNLAEWASFQQATWKNSPNGKLFSSEYFTTNSGFDGISIVRKNGTKKDFHIGINLSTSSWLNRQIKSNESSNPWLHLKLFAFDDPIENEIYKSALKIAKSIELNDLIKTDFPNFTEIKTNSNSKNIVLDQLINDGPISYSINKEISIDYRESYAEIGRFSKLQHNIDFDSTNSPTTLMAFTETFYSNIEEWAAHQKSAWEKSEKGMVVSAEKFISNDGFKGITIVRQTGTTRDFFIVLDLTTKQWSQRQEDIFINKKKPWLRAQITGFYDSIIDGIYPTALEISKSLEYKDSRIKNFQNSFIVEKLNISNGSELNNSIEDGPISFLTSEDVSVDFVKIFTDLGPISEGQYSINQKSNNEFTTLKIFTENIYASIDQWASHQKSTWERNSENRKISTKKFITDQGFYGISIVREDQKSRDFQVAIDLTTNEWRNKRGIDSKGWLRAEFKSLNTPIFRPLFQSSLSMANTLSFNASKEYNLSKFVEISDNTLFNSPKVYASWYKSDWFGTFHQSQSNWIYHELLGWVYPIETSSSDGWFWHEAFDWIWTSEKSFPYFFCFDFSNWIFINQKFIKKSQFYDFKTSSWEKVDILKKIFQDTAGNETETIIKIMNSSLNQKEKMEGVGKVILFGN